MNAALGEIAAINQLEFGNWRTASRILSEGEVRDAYVGANLRTIARAMSYRAAGDFGSASTTLDIAAASVHRRQPGIPVATTRAFQGVRLVLPPDPGARVGVSFRTVRLIWREQGELDRLRRQVAEPPIGLTQDRYILLQAFIEYLCWVEFDRESWLHEPAMDEERAMVELRIDEFRDRRRDGFLRSATDLRRLDRPTAGAMTRPVWDRADQYCGLRRMAIEELGRRPPPPWVDPSVPEVTPARRGASLAWIMAQAT
jgi:hypothetical protein